MRPWRRARARMLPVLLGAALALAGCAGAPLPPSAPVPAAPTAAAPAAPLGEATGSRSAAEALAAARRALAQKDYRGAAQAAQEAAALAPDPAAARLLEAEALQALGDAAGALPLWGAAVEAGPDRPRVWRAYANLAVRQGAEDAALERFEQRLAAPGSGETLAPTLYGIAGWTALALGQTERAAELLERTVGTPAAPAFALALGRARLALGAFAEAEAAAQEVVDAPGGDVVEGWLLLGDLRREQGLAAGAREAYGKVLELAPENYAAQVNLGVLTLQQGDAEGAGALFQTAADLRPEAPEAWLDLGLAERSLAHWGKARQAYLTALEVAPAYTPALKNLGVLIEKYLGQPAQAVPYYQRYLQQVPDDEEVQRWLKNAARLAAQEPGS